MDVEQYCQDDRIPTESRYLIVAFYHILLLHIKIYWLMIDGKRLGGTFCWVDLMEIDCGKVVEKNLTRNHWMTAFPSMELQDCR